MLPSETMIWQPEFTDKTLSRKPGAVQHGMQPSLLFKWKKQYLEGSLTAVAAGEDVVPASELAAAIKQIKELQRLLGKKTDPQRSGESMVSRENG